MPSPADSLIDDAHAAFNRKELDRAFALLQQAVDAAPDHPIALFDLGQLYLLRGELEAAETAFGKALAADPGYRPPALGLVNAALSRKDYEAAHQRLDACPGEPASTDYQLRGIAFAGQHRWAESIEAFTRYAELRPDASDPHLNLYQTYLNQGDRDAAVDALRRAVEATPDRSPLWFLYLHALAEADRAHRLPPACEAMLQAIPDNLTLYNLGARLLSEQGYYAYAARCYRQALAACPGFDPTPFPALIQMSRLV